jgi:hypothetical protein
MRGLNTGGQGAIAKIPRELQRRRATARASGKHDFADARHERLDLLDASRSHSRTAHRDAPELGAQQRRTDERDQQRAAPCRR